MTGPWSLSIVVPTFEGGLCLWLGIGEMLRWRHPAVRRLQLVIVDDASARCGFRAGTVTLADTELVFLVNRRRRGQSRSCLRGWRHGDSDWTVFLEDDLRGWGAIATALVDRFAADLDLVTAARVHRSRPRGLLREGLQPMTRRLFRLASGHDLRDPTSPIKAVRRAAFAAATVDRWQGLLAEGLVLEGRRVAEVVPATVAWDERPSRYHPGDVVGLAARLAPRLLGRALQRALRPGGG